MSESTTAVATPTAAATAGSMDLNGVKFDILTRNPKAGDIVIFNAPKAAPGSSSMAKKHAQNGLAGRVLSHDAAYDAYQCSGDTGSRWKRSELILLGPVLPMWRLECDNVVHSVLFTNEVQWTGVGYLRIDIHDKKNDYHTCVEIDQADLLPVLKAVFDQINTAGKTGEAIREYSKTKVRELGNAS